MKTRILTGLLAIPLFLAICFANEWVFLAFVTLLTGAGLVEWSRAYSVPESSPHTKTQRDKEAEGGTQRPTPNAQRFDSQTPTPDPSSNAPRPTPNTFLGLLFPAFASWLVHRKPEFVGGYNLVQIGVVLIFVALTLNAGKTGIALGNWRQSQGKIGAAGAVYVGFLFSGLVLLRSVSRFGVWALLTTVFCVWATDTFAYFVGRAIGKHKLAPSLSPKKTVEGALGGLIGAAIVGAFMAQRLGVSPAFGATLGGVAGIMGPLGDLWESALKREQGIKDFGAMLPGHGGVLDRFDSLLFVAPFAYLLWESVMR